MPDTVQQRGRLQSAPHLRLLTWEGSDAELLELIALQDETAAGRFHDRFSSGVHALVRALVGPSQFHARLVERSLLTAYRGLYHHHVSVGQLQAWVDFHSVRTVRSHLRRHRWWLLGKRQLQVGGVAEVTRFYRQVSNLPSDLQVAFCLRYVAGRALSETARLLECSVPELRRKLERAEARLGAQPDLLPERELAEVGG